MTDKAEMARRRIVVSGQVQGVGFRVAMQREAERLGVAGWVGNRADGSVEAVLIGEEENVAVLIGWARRGPPAARVDQVRVELVEGDFEHFSVRRDILPAV